MNEYCTCLWQSFSVQKLLKVHNHSESILMMSKEKRGKKSMSIFDSFNKLSDDTKMLGLFGFLDFLDGDNDSSTNNSNNDNNEWNCWWDTDNNSNDSWF